jgi:peptidase YpeB-like protein
MRNRLVLVAATGATVLIAGAGLAVAASPTPTASLASAGQVAPTSTSSPISMNPTGLTGTDVGPGSEITSEEAVRIALAHVGGGRVREIERELEHGRREWKVEVVNGGREHDIRVDATTGAVTRTDMDRDDRGGRDDRGRDDRGHG